MLELTCYEGYADTNHHENENMDVFLCADKSTDPLSGEWMTNFRGQYLDHCIRRDVGQSGHVRQDHEGTGGASMKAEGRL